MEDRKLNRRRFLRGAAISSAAAVVAACKPEVVVETVIQEVERVVKETVIIEGESKVVEKVVKETVIVEKEAAATGFQGTIEHYAQAYTPLSANTNPDPNSPQREALDLLAAEWMDMHPGITIKFMEAPTGTYTDWINTQLVGGTGPDIFWLWLGSLHGWADDGKTVVINDYLKLPNKYTPSDEPWEQTFLDPFLESYSVKGNFGGVPMDLVSTGIYTNRDLLEQAGIDFDAELNTELGSPDSWAVLMEWMEKLQAIGVIPITMDGSNSFAWFWRNLADQLGEVWLDELDVLNYHEGTPIYQQEGFMSQEEQQHGWWCLDWNVWEREETREMYRIFKEWQQYFQLNWQGEGGGQKYDLFVTGQAAMTWDGSWQIGPLLQDDRRDFEMVSFFIPPITKETTPVAQDPPVLPIGLGGYGSIAYGLNHMTVKRGNVEECIDWLMFLTTPLHNEMVVNEVPSFVPAVVGTKALPEIENLFVGQERLQRGSHPVRSFEYIFGYAESKYNDLWERENELYFLGEQTLDQTMANMIDICWQQAPADIRAAAIQYSEDGNWDLTQWECNPDV